MNTYRRRTWQNLMHILDGRYRTFFFIGMSTVLALFLAPPKIDRSSFSDHHSYWPTVEAQSENLFAPINAPEGSHGANKSFRLAVPLIAKMLGLSRKGIFLLQVATFFLMMGMALSLAARITSDSIAASLFAGAMVPLYVVLCSYHDMTGHLDAFAYLFLFSSMYFRHPILVFLSCFLASWCDERAFLASSLIFIWWFFQDEEARQLRIPGRENYSESRAMAVVASVVAYIIVRLLLTSITDLSVEMEKLDLLLVKEYTSLVPLLTYCTFGALWGVVLIAGGILINQKKYLLFSSLALPFILQASVACMVWDFTRSLSFSFPILFLSLLVMRQYCAVKTLKIGLLIILLLSLISPIIFFDSQITTVYSVGYHLFDYLVKTVASVFL